MIESIPVDILVEPVVGVLGSAADVTREIVVEVARGAVEGGVDAGRGAVEELIGR